MSLLGNVWWLFSPFSFVSLHHFLYTLVECPQSPRNCPWSRSKHEWDVVSMTDHRLSGSSKWKNTSFRLACTSGNGRPGDLDLLLRWGLSKLPSNICLDKFTKSTGILRSHLSAGEGAARDFQPYIWSCFSLHHREVWEEKWLMVISQLWMPRGRAWAAEDLQWSTAETILPSEWEPEGTHPPKMRN